MDVTPFPTRTSETHSPVEDEWQRFTRRARRYWCTRQPQDRADALAALSRFAVAFCGLHGDRAVIPICRGRT